MKKINSEKQKIKKLKQLWKKKKDGRQKNGKKNERKINNRMKERYRGKVCGQRGI